MNAVDKKIGELQLINYIKMDAFKSIRPVRVQVKDLKLSVSTSALFQKPKESSVLENISFDIAPGQVIAIMGASGSGKTTALHALAGQFKSGKTSGLISFNGQSPGSFYENGAVGYVQQHDYLTPYLKVRETLRYNSELKLSSKLSRAEKYELVENVIMELGLKECADTIIGDDWRKGISGGEKRRVSVASQLLLNPSLLFMDEPTTGLDAFTSNNLIQTLVGLSRRGRTVFISIHQPRSDIFKLFDTIILLSQGKLVYAGQGGDAVISYFKDLGHECPAQVNPADFLIDLTSIDYRDADSEATSNLRVNSLIDAWKVFDASKLAFVGSAKAQIPHEIPVDRSQELQTSVFQSRHFGASFIGQTAILTRRGWVNLTRDQLYLWGNMFESVVMALIFGWIFLGSTQGKQSVYTKLSALYTGGAMQSYLMTIFTIYKTCFDMKVFDRERGERLYGAGPYLLAQFFSQLVSNIFFPTVYAIIMYFMIGLRSDDLGLHLGYYICNFILTNLIVGALCQLATSIARDFEVSSLIANMAFTFISFSTGYFIQLDSIPIYLRWISKVSFMTYHFRWSASSEFTNNVYPCFETDGAICIGNNVLNTRGIDQGDYFWPPIAMGLIYVAYMTLSFLLLKFYVPDTHRHAKPVSSSLSKRPVALNVEKQEVKRYNTRVELKKVSLRLETTHVGFTKHLGDTEAGSYVKTLLDDVSVKLEPGSLSIVMGGSGTGKTTLLSLLTGRQIQTGTFQKLNQTGQITFNGVQETKSSRIASMCSYVRQSDGHLLPALTCRETLYYAAQVRLPSSMSKASKTARAEEILAILGLRHCADTIVGNESVKGMSGGEKRRLSIGVQLLTDPSVLIIDEPTSGLDSFTAYYLMQTLKDLALSGRTIVCSVHQPRSDIFTMFDTLLLLTRGGRVAYAGPAHSVVSYFDQAGYPLPVHTNPADHILDISSVDLRNHVSELKTRTAVDRLVSDWKARTLAIDIEEDVKIGSEPTFVERKRSPFHVAFPILLSRSLKNAQRQPLIVLSRIMQVVSLGIIQMLYFIGQDHSQTSVQNRIGILQQTGSCLFIGLLNCVAVFPAERNTLFYEYSDLAYSVEPFFLAYNVIEIPIEILSAVLYTVFVLILVKLNLTVTSFLCMTLSVFIITNVGESIGIAFASVVHHIGFSISITNAVLGYFNVMAGFMSNTLPVFLDRLNRISPIAYSARLMAINEFAQDVTYVCTTQETLDGLCLYHSGEDVLATLSISGVACGLAVGYRLIAYAILRWKTSSRAY